MKVNKNWFNNLFEIKGYSAPYTTAFVQQGLYHAWSVCMLLYEDRGTDIISGVSMPSSTFDNLNDIYSYIRHHKSDKASLSMVDLFLVLKRYHPIYESFSELNSDFRQEDLKARINQLFEVGLNKYDGDVKCYEGNPSLKMWVSESDFKRIFPNSLKYKIEFEGEVIERSLYELWSNTFTENTFNSKLKDINLKIQVMKNAIKEGKNPDIVWLNSFYKEASDRFFEGGKRFSEMFIKYASEHPFDTPNAGSLGSIWHMQLMRKIFNL